MKAALILIPYANPHSERFFKYVDEHFNTDYYIHKNSSHYRRYIKGNDLEIKSLSLVRALINIHRGKYDIIFSGGIFYSYNIFLNLFRNKRLIILSEMFPPKSNRGIKRYLKKLHFSNITKKNKVLILMRGGDIILDQYRQLTPTTIRGSKYGHFPDLTLTHNTHSVENQPVKFVFAGQFIDRKNIINLLKAIELCDEFKSGEAEFVFIGEGPLATSISSTPTVNLLNTLPKKELFDQLSTSDVLVLVSNFEGWGSIVVEACSCGCALILSEGIGASHLFLTDGENGITCTGQPESIAKGFKLMLGSKSKLEKMKKKSAQIFTDNYSKHDELLGQMINKFLE